MKSYEKSFAAMLMVLVLVFALFTPAASAAAVTNTYADGKIQITCNTGTGIEASGADNDSYQVTVKGYEDGGCSESTSVDVTVKNISGSVLELSFDYAGAVGGEGSGSLEIDGESVTATGNGSYGPRILKVDEEISVSATSPSGVGNNLTITVSNVTADVATVSTINFESNTANGWISESDSVSGTAVTTSTSKAGSAYTVYAIPKVVDGWDFEGLYTDAGYTDKVTPDSGNYRKFNLSYPAEVGETVTYYAKFVQITDTVSYSVTYDPTYISNVRFSLSGALFNHDNGSLSCSANYSVANSGDSVTLYKGMYISGINYSFSDPSGEIINQGVVYGEGEGTAFPTYQKVLVAGSTLPASGTQFRVKLGSRAYQDMTVSSAVFANADSEANLELQTRGDYPWTETEDHTLASGSTGIDASVDSYMKIKSKKPGILSFEYSTSSESNYDYLGYLLGSTDPTRTSATNSGSKGAWSGVTDWTPFEIVVAENQDLRLVYSKDSWIRNEDTVWIRNIKLEYGDRDITCSTNDPAQGKIVYNDTDLTENQVLSLGLGTSCTLTATPAEGYVFNYWQEYIDGEWKIISTDAALTFMISDARNLKANFAQNYVGEGETAIAKVYNPTDKIFYGPEFGTLEKAFNYAQNGEIVVLTTDYTQTTDLTIPENKTLLVPYNNSTVNTNFDEPTEVNTGIADASKVFSQYRCLTLADDVDITVNGTLVVNASHYPGGGGTNSTVSTYARIGISDTSKITVNNGAKLYAWGYITGGGEVTAESGSTIYEFMQINDFRGGTDTLNMIGETNQFPLNQYYIQNIESKLTIKYGAVENVFSHVYMSMHVRNMSEFIGDEGMFVLAEGSYLVKYYDAARDMMVYEIHGDASIGTLEITVSSSTVNTDDYYLPINAMEIKLFDSTFSCDKDVIFLPGSTVEVDSDSSIIVESGGNVVFADKDISPYSGPYSNGVPCDPVQFSPTRAAANKRTWANTTAASIDNNGSIVVEDGGAFGSTSDGANIYSSTGNGIFMIEGENLPQNIDKYYGPDKYSTETTNIPIVTPVLTDESGTEHGTDVEDRWFTDQPTTFSQVNGVWGDYRYVELYLDDEADPEEEEPDYRSDEPISKDKLDDYIASIEGLEEPTKADEELYRFEFLTWDNIIYDYTEGNKSYVCLAPFYTEYYKMTWDPDNGSEPLETWVKNGDMPVCPFGEEELVKAPDRQTSYIFNGWSPVIIPAREPVDYTAVYNENKHSLTLNGTIGVNFYMALPTGYNASNTTMDFSWGHKYISTNTYEEDIPYSLTDVTGTADGSFVKFTCPVAAKEINDEITATLKSGDKILTTEIYRGADYAYDLIAMSDDELTPLVRSGKTPEQLKQLVKKMLVYCSMAQTNFEYEFSGLADAGLDAADKALPVVSADDFARCDFSGIPYYLSYYGSSLNLGSDTAFDIYFEDYALEPLNSGSATVQGTDVVLPVTFQQIRYAAKVHIADIPAALVNSDIDLTINGTTFTVSTSEYINLVLSSDDSTQELKNAVVALYSYGDIASTYFG